MFSSRSDKSMPRQPIHHTAGRGQDPLQHTPERPHQQLVHHPTGGAQQFILQTQGTQKNLVIKKHKSCRVSISNSWLLFFIIASFKWLRQGIENSCRHIRNFLTYFYVSKHFCYAFPIFLVGWETLS